MSIIISKYGPLLRQWHFLKCCNVISHTNKYFKGFLGSYTSEIVHSYFATKIKI